jgi:hypothetical protein
MWVIYMNSRLNRRSRTLPPRTAWQQFPDLLSAPVVEPRVLSCNTGKQRFQIRPSWEYINRSLRYMNVETGNEAGQFNFSGNICFEFSVQCRPL